MIEEEYQNHLRNYLFYYINIDWQVFGYVQ